MGTRTVEDDGVTQRSVDLAGLEDKGTIGRGVAADGDDNVRSRGERGRSQGLDVSNTPMMTGDHDDSKEWT